MQDRTFSCCIYFVHIWAINGECSQVVWTENTKLGATANDDHICENSMDWSWFLINSNIYIFFNTGIVHSDLKPANFVIVNASLKLIDFGIANRIQPDVTSIMKDSQVRFMSCMVLVAFTCSLVGWTLCVRTGFMSNTGGNLELYAPRSHQRHIIPARKSTFKGIVLFSLDDSTICAMTWRV